MHLYDNPLGFEGFPAFMGFFSSNDFPKSDNINVMSKIYTIWKGSMTIATPISLGSSCSRFRFATELVSGDRKLDPFNTVYIFSTALFETTKVF